MGARSVGESSGLNNLRVTRRAFPQDRLDGPLRRRHDRLVRILAEPFGIEKFVDPLQDLRPDLEQQMRSALGSAYPLG
jgi:hypothetical protein